MAVIRFKFLACGRRYNPVLVIIKVYVSSALIHFRIVWIERMGKDAKSPVEPPPWSLIKMIAFVEPNSDICLAWTFGSRYFSECKRRDVRPEFECLFNLLANLGFAEIIAWEIAKAISEVRLFPLFYRLNIYYVLL